MENYFPSPSINENELAIVQKTDYASRQINKGWFVYWNGKLRSAKNDILQGAELSASLFNEEPDSKGVLNELSDHLANLMESPVFHPLTLPSGLYNYPQATGRTGYMIYPDGKIRLEINVAGLTAGIQNMKQIQLPSIIGQHHQTVVSSIWGVDGTGYSANLGSIAMAPEDQPSILRLRSTSTYCCGHVLEFYLD